MPDFVTTYTYTASGATIIFNNGDLGDGTDKFWLQAIQGLDGPNVRAPVDQVPMGNGSLLHAFWLSGRTPVLEGVLLIESVRRNRAALSDRAQRDGGQPASGGGVQRRCLCHACLDTYRAVGAVAHGLPQRAAAPRHHPLGQLA